MRRVFLVLFLCVISIFTFSQKKISGKSDVFNFNSKPVYEKGEAPDLKADAKFIDENKNGILDPGENAYFEVTLSNQGKGTAQGVNVWLKTDFNQQHVSVQKPSEIYFIQPNKSVIVDIPVTADSNLILGTNKAEIDITENFGFNPKPVYLNLDPVYSRGMPPNLFMDMSFEDENNNGVLESSESGLLKMQISNKGAGVAQGLKLSIEDNISDSNFIIGSTPEIFYLNPDESAYFEIPITAKFNIQTHEHKLSINLSEHFGYDMDPAYLVLNSLEYQKPQIVFAGYEVIDYGEGTSAVMKDGQLQAGEMVKLKIIVQNIGTGKALNVDYKVTENNPNIYIDNDSGHIGTIGPGDIADFTVNYSPNKKVESSDDLSTILNITEKLGNGDLKDFKLPIVLNQKPPTANLIEVKADLDKLTQQIARFEYSSNKFTTNVGKIVDIADIKPSKSVRKNAVAIVFGVEEYTNLPPAPYAANDADYITKYLKDVLGIEQVVTYKNADVSGFIFDDVFNTDNGELQKAIVKGETELFVFYSGHGIPSKAGDEIYLFPSDGRVERLDRQGYNINDLYNNLNQLGAKNTVVFIDACFSGSSRTSEKVKIENLVAQKGVKINPKLVEPWQTNPNFSVFNSSGPNETSLGFDPSKTGLFTYYLCAGLKGEADENKDNKITNMELYNYVFQKVTETSKKIFGVQTPQFHGNKDYTLVEF